MTKQTKWALAVVAFVVTATVARRVGQYEVMDQVEKRIRLVEPPVGHGTFSSLVEDQTLRECILDGYRSACHVVAERLARPQFVQPTESDAAPDPFWSQFPPADPRPQ